MFQQLDIQILFLLFFKDFSVLSLYSFAKTKKIPLDLVENPELKFLFESLAGQHVFFGELPVKMQERGSQQTGCLLFTVGQIDSVRPGL